MRQRERRIVASATQVQIHSGLADDHCAILIIPSRVQQRNGELVFPVAFVDPAGIGYFLHHRGPRVQHFEELVRAYLVARLVSLHIQQRHWDIARICSIGDLIAKVIIKQNWTVAGFQ